jgi:hypothetical protein
LDRFRGSQKEDEHGRLRVITVIPGCIGLSKHLKREPGYTWRLASHEYLSLEPEPYNKKSAEQETLD